MQKPDFFNLPQFQVQTKPPAVLMALDYGKARIGVALTNPEQTLTFAHKTLARPRKLQALLLEIQALNIKWEVKGLVLGYPLNADGTESRMCQAVRQFARQLSGLIDIPLYLQDERWTSDPELPPKNRDAAAAQKILEEILKIS